MPSGWVRFLLEQFEFPFEVVYPQTLDAGNLKAKYDVLLFPDGGIPESEGGGGGFGGGGQPPNDVPEEYRDQLGRVTIKQTLPQLKQFVEAGGAIVAFGGSAVLGHHLGLPVSDHLVEVGSERRRTLAAAARSSTFPGSILRVAVDNTNPLALRLAEAGGRDVRQQPGPAPRARRVAARRAAGRVVRQQGRRCAPDGRGASTISKAASPESKRRSARARCSCSDRRSRSARSRTGRSSSCSTGSITERRRRSGRLRARPRSSNGDSPATPASRTPRVARRRTRAARVLELGGKNRLAWPRKRGEPKASRPAPRGARRPARSRRLRAQVHFSTISAFSFPTTSSSSCRSFAGTLN